MSESGDPDSRESAQPAGVDPAEGSALSRAGLPDSLAHAMERRGFESLTSVQSAVWNAVWGTGWGSGRESPSEGRDLRISSQTGSGKTVAIGLALARHLESGRAPGARRPSVLVLVPTRELAMQVRDELRWLFAELRDTGIEVVMGGTSIGAERRALSRSPRIVVGTPGRTLDHLKAGALSLEDVVHVVLDESDRMLDLGFREDLEAILERLPAERRTHLVSATFPEDVRQLADRFQRDALHVEGTRLGVANADIQHDAHVVAPRQVYAALVNLLLLHAGARCLIFVERRVDASSLAEKLSGDGFPVQPFSGELPQAQRTRTLAAFRDGTIRTLVSTDVAARGIDVPDIELVIHVDPPGDAESYTHRSGRTGRAGRAGRSVLLVPPRARRHVERLLRTARIDAAFSPAPSAAKVRKLLRKRFRQEIHQRLGEEQGPSQTQIDYAKQLLDGRDASTVVATLLDLAQPVPPREPMEVESRDLEPTRPTRRAPRGPATGFVRFRINWGESNGAAINRILGHVCRRGQLRGHQVGSIEIGPEASSFDVDASVADRFEKLVRRPDARDPHLRIVRDTSAGPGSERHRFRLEPRPGPRSGPRPGTSPGASTRSGLELGPPKAKKARGGPKLHPRPHPKGRPKG